MGYHFMSRNRGLKSFVTQLSAEGKSEAEIVIALDCNCNTVKYHLSEAFREAHRAKRAASRRSNKLELVKSAGGKCSVCGYDKSFQALQFHHVDPSNKSFSIANSSFRNYEKLKTEAEKCVLVCANCHAEIEAGIISLPPLGREANPVAFEAIQPSVQV